MQISLPEKNENIIESAPDSDEEAIQKKEKEDSKEIKEPSQFSSQAAKLIPVNFSRSSPAYVCNLRRSQSANNPGTPLRMKVRTKPKKHSPLITAEEIHFTKRKEMPNIKEKPVFGTHKLSVVDSSEIETPPIEKEIILTKGPRGFGFTLRAIRVYLAENSDHFTLQHLVVSIENGSAASVAGIKPGDLITHINNDPIEGLLHTDVIRYIVQSGNSLRIRTMNINETSIKRTSVRKKSSVDLKMVKPRGATRVRISPSGIGRLHQKHAGNFTISGVSTECTSSDRRKHQKSKQTAGSY